MHGVYDRAKLAIELKGLFSAKAKERQKGGQGGVLLSAILPEASIDTRAELAKIAGCFTRHNFKYTEFHNSVIM